MMAWVNDICKMSPFLIIDKKSFLCRPKSFAQKFRPNSRLAGAAATPSTAVGGGAGVGPAAAEESPLSEQAPHDSFILTSAPLEMISEEQGRNSMDIHNMNLPKPAPIHVWSNETCLTL